MQIKVLIFLAHANIFFIHCFFHEKKQGLGQTVNGEIDSVDYSAKTHELQTIIEKQVSF